MKQRYEIAATEELERKILELEKPNKTSEDRFYFISNVINVESNIEFARQLSLVSEKQLAEFTQRVRKVKQEFYGIVPDSREEKLHTKALSLDDYTRQINELKAEKTTQQNSTASQIVNKNRDMVRPLRKEGKI